MSTVDVAIAVRSEHVTVRHGWDENGTPSRRGSQHYGLCRDSQALGGSRGALCR